MSYVFYFKGSSKKALKSIAIFKLKMKKNKPSTYGKINANKHKRIKIYTKLLPVKYSILEN